MGIRGDPPQTQAAGALGSLALNRGQGGGSHALCSCSSYQTTVSRLGPSVEVCQGLGQHREHRKESSNGLGARGQEGVSGVCLLCLCVFIMEKQLPRTP